MYTRKLLIHDNVSDTDGVSESSDWSLDNRGRENFCKVREVMRLLL